MITIITSLKKTTSESVLLEILDQKSIVYYQNLGIDPVILEKIEKNLSLKKDAEKSMTFYGKFFNAKKLIAFFPKKDSCIDDRSEALRNAPKKTLYIPSCDFQEAFEALTLSTYSYDQFLSKKEEKLYEFYITESERDSIESMRPLLTAITRARDLINLPPTDTRPEEFINYIQQFNWKRFKLRIIDAASLKKLGCNLLLAV